MILSLARRGSALVIVAVTMVLLLSLATVLTERTVSGLQDESRRKDDLLLIMASESAANQGLTYLQTNWTLLDARKTAGAIDTKPNTIDSMDLDITKEVASLYTAPTINGRPLSIHWSYLGERTVVKGTDPVTGVSRFNVVPSGTAGSTDQDVYLVTATATAGRDASGKVMDANRLRTRTVQLLFVPYPQNVFVRAMFSHSGFDFQGSATTDSWDSATGSYGGTLGAQGKKGDIGSEGDIDVLKPTNVYGSINPNLTFPLPPVVYEPTAAYVPGGALDYSTTLTTGEYRATYVNLSAGDVLTINGTVNLYVDGPISMATKSNGSNPTGNVLVYATPTSRLTIFQDDYDPANAAWSSLQSSWDINAGDVMGNIDNPSSFLVISAFSGDMKLNGNAKFGGVLYAPNATLQMNGTFDFLGAVISDAFASKSLSGVDEMGKVNGNFSFHYDEQLANLLLPLPPRLGVVGWFTQIPVL